MKDIIGYEGLYALTEEGDVWSYGNRAGANHKGRFLKTSLDRDGYKRCGLKNLTGRAVHKRIGRLMAETYLGLTDKNLQVNHKNGIRSDDRLVNLEIVTPSENIIHSHKVLMNRNQKCSNNNAFKEWGYFDANDKMKIFKDKSVDTWCRENQTSSSNVYVSMKEKRKIKQGKLKGFRFFRLSDNFGSTGK